MRDRETIDSELRRVAAELRSIRERGGLPSSQQVDALLDERLGHPVEVMSDTAVLDEILAPFVDTVDRPRRRRRGRLLRFALRAAVPLSVLAMAAMLVAMFTLHRHHRPVEPVATPVSDERVSPVPAPALHPPSAPPTPADIAEKAMVDALQQEGVPVPSRDYAATQGHAVCDFLGRQPNFSDATQFVQRSTIWDNQQSADFAAAAVVTYCPQFEATTNSQAQQTMQKSETTLQTIEGDLQGINRDLEGIKDGLHGGA
ncbi:DUF732 domain-containing protein [Mycobacterium sp.]|uniref:DUF732 domain-containing protein n=1 Tax=Mycobacterium sp. TaxID=1785 RepID=UPI0025EC3F1C|nr:DUF732 domain-containing protein [Mycobacterium sp.]